MSSISFDSSKAGIFWTLCTGGTLVISKKRLEQDIEKIGEMIHRNSVSHTLMLPSLYATILDYIDVSKLQSLKTVIVAGEACTSAVCSSHFEKLPQTALYNEYGPTEATVWCIAHHIQKEDEFRSAAPIGKPVANAEIYILDNDLQPVPLRSTGEIYVGGPGLSEGYLNHPVLTAASFIAHPFKGNTGEKLYKTGDLGRYTSDGTIEFLGRADQQLKIRGFRIEPGEIEKILDEYPQIEKTVVLVEDTVRGNGHLNQGATELATIEEYLKKVQDGQQIENILSSIQSLNENEREYLLQQIQ
jgi:amino acid adenylation domain-containing protein